MKKLLSILGAVGIVASSASTVVACGGVKEIPFDSYKDDYSDIGLITDTGKTNDKSFNESGYNAGNNFAKQFKADFKEISVTQPGSLSELSTSYAKSIKSGVNTLILPGFQHQTYVPKISKLMGEHRSAVFLDGDTNGQNNVIGLNYKSDISGFYAGFASIIEFFNLHADENKNAMNTLKLATFGGIANPVAVTPYMAGFLAAIDAFDNLMSSQDTN
ncbi:hypothetical protein Zmor_008909 [Zophobas morio]|uniref:ABC transporter substrate-binding protein PnrA-like domain-containing protein n=1 Tax=Zophobas morio TaxID=2755281 RepID=A0AA38HJ42_9CUCU|nr:hypothetical protein Zmor_008909 [Zophobas morio]